MNIISGYCVIVIVWFRLVEEVKQKCEGVQLQNEDVYMATTFQSFIQMFVRRLRGEDQEEELVIDYVTKDINNMTVKMPYQCFINGNFEDAEDGKTYNTVNPTDGSVCSLISNTHIYSPLAWLMVVLCFRLSVRCHMHPWQMWTERLVQPKRPSTTDLGERWILVTVDGCSTGKMC